MALTAVAPLGASAGVNVQITGTGFDPIASNNTVTLTPQGGAAVNLVAETIAVLDAVKGLRRIGITVPPGLPIGAAAVMVRNRTTNESAGGRTLQIIQISLPQTASAVRGAQKVGVRIDGSANVQFVAGRTTPTFGAGDHRQLDCRSCRRRRSSRRSQFLRPPRSAHARSTSSPARRRHSS